MFKTLPKWGFVLLIGLFILIVTQLFQYRTAKIDVDVVDLQIQQRNDYQRRANELKESQNLIDLARHYHTGLPDRFVAGKKVRGVPPNPELAIRYYEQAATNGCVECLIDIGDIYHYGLYDLPADPQKAQQYYYRVYRLSGHRNHPHLKGVAEEKLLELEESSGHLTQTMIRPVEHFETEFLYPMASPSPGGYDPFANRYREPWQPLNPHMNGGEQLEYFQPFRYASPQRVVAPDEDVLNTAHPVLPKRAKKNKHESVN